MAVTKEIGQVAVQKETLEGKCIDGFTVLELKGRGGFSDVYRVQDNLGQIFALKMVRDKKHALLLEQEAKILAGLSHAQIPRVVRFGECEDRSFVVMDYVPKTLQEVVDSGKLVKNGETLEFVALNITKQLLNILVYTHEKGVVHKDLKPKNVGFDKDGNVVVYDFNIAKNLVAVAKEAPDVCSVIESDVVQVGGFQKSVLGGTEGYSSPEQRKMKVDGKVHPVDQRSDMYAVGVMLYEMLVGHLPQGNYEKPSEKVGTPKWLDGVVDKALAQNPDKRYKTARDMRVDIERGLEGKLDSENRVAKYVKETILPTAHSVAKTVGSAVWKAVKFPFWVYAFGIPRYIDEKHNQKNWNCYASDDCVALMAATIIGTIALWVGTLVSVVPYLTADPDKKFIEDFKKDPKGTIVCEHEGRLKYFRAKDALEKDVRYWETSTPKIGVENLVVDEGVLYFTAREKEESRQALYSLKLATGEERMCFNFDKPVDALVKTMYPSAKQILPEMKADALQMYDGNLVNGVIKQVSFKTEGDDTRIFLQIGSGWYSINKSGDDFRKENIAVVSQASTRNPLVCPHGTHELDWSFGDGLVQLEWSAVGLGSYATPVRGCPKAWLDYELPENK